MADDTSTLTAEEIAQTVARQLALREDSSGGETGSVIVLGEGGALGAVAGGFTLAIKYNDTTYTLVVQTPTVAGQPYVFSVTDAKDTALTRNIITFKYVDSSNWSADANVPPISFGTNFSIEKLSFNLKEGTVPPSQTLDLLDGPDGATE